MDGNEGEFEMLEYDSLDEVTSDDSVGDESKIWHTNFNKPKFLKNPWTLEDDSANYRLLRSEYERFEAALGKYSSDEILNNTLEWISDMEEILPRFKICLKHYAEGINCNEDSVNILLNTLTDWVIIGFDLNLAYGENEFGARHIMVGARIASTLFRMNSSLYAKHLTGRYFLHSMLDVIVSEKTSSSLKRDLADVLRNSLYHSSAISDDFYNQIQNGKSPEGRLSDILNEKVIGNDAALLVHRIYMFHQFVRVLQKLFLYYQALQINESRMSEYEALHDDIQHVTFDYLLERPWCDGEFKVFAYRALIESHTVNILCVLIASSEIPKNIREASAVFLMTIVGFDICDITGVLFLFSLDSRSSVDAVMSCCRHAEVLSQTFEGEIYRRTCLGLKVIRLVDDLAFANAQNSGIANVDSPDRVNALKEIFQLCTPSNGASMKVVLAVFSYSDYLDHLLKVFKLGQDPNADHTVTARLRSSASYGYAVEILLAIARSQSKGSFWRRYGPAICRLIDTNLISAASAIKQWTDPLRDPLSHGTSASALHYLVQRLEMYKDRFMAGDPPFALITTLRLINSLLVKCVPTIPADMGSSSVPYNLCWNFYGDNGLKKVCECLKLANLRRGVQEESDRGVPLTSDLLIHTEILRSSLLIIAKTVAAFAHTRKINDFSPVGVLLRTYALCCEPQFRYPVLKRIIWRTFAVYLSAAFRGPSNTKTNVESFLQRLIECGIETPSNFLALTTLLSNFVSSPCFPEFNPATGRLCYLYSSDAREQWSNVFMEYADQLRFIILFGMSSSRDLRCSTADLCVHLARLSDRLACFIATEMVKRGCQILCTSTNIALQNAASLENFGNKTETIGEVRLGAAVDFVAASLFALISICSRDEVIRSALVVVFSNNPMYMRTALKFFEVASRKTIPHVFFQIQLIKLFKNICEMGYPENRKPHLSQDIFLKICDSLAQHIEHREQSFETIIPSLEALYTISSSSEHGLYAVQKAFLSRPGSLIRFTKRLASSTDCSDSVIKVTANILSQVFCSALTNKSLRLAVLQWPPAGDERMEEGCGEHPLLQLILLLRNRSDLEPSCDKAIGIFEALMAFVQTHPFDSNEIILDDCKWPTSGLLSDVIEDAALKENDNTNLAFSGVDFDPPTIPVDLNSMVEEFYPKLDLTGAARQLSVNEDTFKNGSNRNRRSYHGQVVGQEETKKKRVK